MTKGSDRGVDKFTFKLKWYDQDPFPVCLHFGFACWCRLHYQVGVRVLESQDGCPRFWICLKGHPAEKCTSDCPVLCFHRGPGFSLTSLIDDAHFNASLGTFLHWSHKRLCWLTSANQGASWSAGNGELWGWWGVSPTQTAWLESVDYNGKRGRGKWMLGMKSTECCGKIVQLPLGEFVSWVVVT